MPLMRVLLLLVRAWVRVLVSVLLLLLLLSAKLTVRRELLREPVRKVRPSREFSASRCRRLERRARVGRVGNLVRIHWRPTNKAQEKSRRASRR